MVELATFVDRELTAELPAMKIMKNMIIMYRTQCCRIIFLLGSYYDPFTSS